MRQVHKDITELFKPYPWKVEEDTFNESSNRTNETIFAQGNGYIGVRGLFEEGFYGNPENADPEIVLNAVYEYFPYNHVWARPGYPLRWHSVVAQINPFDVPIEIDGEKVSLAGKVTGYKRTQDLRRGLLTRIFTFTTSAGKEIDFSFERFVSMDDRHLCAMKLKITANADCRISLCSKLDRRIGSPDKAADLRKNHEAIYDFKGFSKSGEVVTAVNKIKVSGFEIATSYTDFTVPAAPYEIVKDKLSYTRKYNAGVKKGEPLEFFRFAGYAASRDDADYKNSAIKSVKSAAKSGYDKCRAKHTAHWDKFWDVTDIQIQGDDSVQQGVRFCMFMINQSTGRDGITNISANGLMGIGYSGHTFWDTELFMMPMFMYSDPDTAKQLIKYRYNILDKARERAKQMDDVGALFAWNSINGEECGHVFEAVTAQYHINNDVFYGIYRYFETTGDEEFMAGYGAEILFEISRCMAHRGAFIPLRDNKFCINVVCGPDEYTPIVDNNCYTNWLTRKQLYFTLEIADMLENKYPEKYAELTKKCGVDDAEKALWKRAADNMYIGYHEGLGIYTQDDQFLYRDPVDIEKLAKEKYPLLVNMHPLNLWRVQVAKQADIVLLIYILSNEFTPEMRKRIFDYYEPRTIHDSSLSPSVHSIVACDIGYADEAYGYLKQACRMDLDNYNKNAASGLHAACSGSAYMMIINGFCGTRCYDGILHFKPYVPKTWQEYSFKYLFKGARIGVTVRKGKITVKLLSGQSLVFEMGGVNYNLDKKNIEISLSF